MARTFVGESKNACKIYVETENSHAATHLADTPGLLELVKEAVPKVEIPDIEGEVKLEVDMGRPIGRLELVTIQSGEEVTYAKRINRDTYIPLVKRDVNDLPMTTMLVLRLDKRAEKEYTLYTTYIGYLTPPVPHGDGREESKSIDYWSQHALIHGSQEVSAGTETTTRPW